MEYFKTCSVFGHSEIEETEDLRIRLKNTLEELIAEKGYGIFLFGALGGLMNLHGRV